MSAQCLPGHIGNSPSLTHPRREEYGPFRVCAQRIQPRDCMQDVPVPCHTPESSRITRIVTEPARARACVGSDKPGSARIAAGSIRPRRLPRLGPIRGKCGGLPALLRLRSRLRYAPSHEANPPHIPRRSIARAACRAVQGGEREGCGVGRSDRSRRAAMWIAGRRDISLPAGWDDVRSSGSSRR